MILFREDRGQDESEVEVTCMRGSEQDHEPFPATGPSFKTFHRMKAHSKHRFHL